MGVCDATTATSQTSTPGHDDMTPITCTIDGKTWTEVDRLTRTLGNGQTLTTVKIERIPTGGYGVFRTEVTQILGKDHATVRDIKGNEIKIPALSL